MVATEAVVDVGGAFVQEGIEILLVDPQEVLAGDTLDDRVIHGCHPEYVDIVNIRVHVDGVNIIRQGGEWPTITAMRAPRS